MAPECADTEHMSPPQEKGNHFQEGDLSHIGFDNDAGDDDDNEVAKKRGTGARQTMVTMTMKKAVAVSNCKGSPRNASAPKWLLEIFDEGRATMRKVMTPA